MSIELGQLTDESHPFLSPLAAALQVDDILPRIRYSPLDGLDVASLSNSERHVLLDLMQERLFEPTTTTLELATRLFRMIRRGYLSRDPRQLSIRRETMALAACSGKKLSELPSSSAYAQCIRVSGETGTGKSYEIKNALRLLPQCIVHSENKAAGWSHQVQLVWLYVPMSHDGTLGGLLLNILCAIDEAAGTSYSTQPSLIRLSNEKLAVHVGIILRIHAVGVLVIDEIQQRNFSGMAHGGLAALFFLRLLNFGIPMVLMGNPFGLGALDRYSQDVRRTSSAGSFDFEPISLDDFDWHKCIAPGVWRYYVLPEPMTFSDPGGEILFQYSGGFRDYACRICHSAQRLALDLNERALTVEHLQQAYEGVDFSQKDRDLIEGFVHRDPIRLLDFEDVRCEHYAHKWGLLSQTKDNSKEPTAEQYGSKSPLTTESEMAPPESAGRKKNPHAREMTAAKQAAAKRASAEKKRAEGKALCDGDDLRNEGLKNFLIKGFDAFRNVA
ncbi:ATP-binding protein [Azospira sp. I13]|uniref:ATP-binding protein n=1 Tax=Azospira sp. I13 TaxID=1765050 RepID=UPI000D59B0A0|nr:ATP-binding protein [Azospira sp. I13]